MWITWCIIFCIQYSRSFCIYLIKHTEKTDNPSIKIYVNKIKSRITFKIKTGQHIKLLEPETMKLLGGNRNKISKDETGENATHLEITELLLLHCKYC